MDIVERLRLDRPCISDVDCCGDICIEAADEIKRLRGALRTINGLIPKTKENTAFPHWGAIAGDIAEGALNGTWPAPAKEKE